MKYSGKLLARVQNEELSILRDFDSLCTANRLHYFAIGGTALGAIRHRGFIPWDDDIDVGMPRDDYEKFMELSDSAYGGKYIAVTAERFPGCTMMNTHWCEKGTVFCDRISLNAPYPSGIFLDIFPFDPVADSRILRFFQAWSAWFWNKMLILSEIREPVLHLSGFRKHVAQFFCWFAHTLIRFFSISPSSCLKHSLKACKRYEGRKTAAIAYLCDTNLYGDLIDLSDLYPIRRAEFSGMTICIPANAHKLLTLLYGNYMELPPVEQRYNHAPERVVFAEERTDLPNETRGSR